MAEITMVQSAMVAMVAQFQVELFSGMLVKAFIGHFSNECSRLKSSNSNAAATTTFDSNINQEEPMLHSGYTALIPSSLSISQES